jgi:acyl-CoA hydrolase
LFAFNRLQGILLQKTELLKWFVIVVSCTGAGVVTTRGHVRYVVTEHGVADLFGKSLQQRACALIDIADPSHREALMKAAFERFKVMPSML